MLFATPIHEKKLTDVSKSVFFCGLILLMEGILHHLGCIKPCKYWDKLHINWCRISSINSISLQLHQTLFWQSFQKGERFFSILSHFLLLFSIGAGQLLGRKDDMIRLLMATRNPVN